MQDLSCNILGFWERTEYRNQFFQFCFAFFFFPRWLLIDLVHWVKRELKTLKKKSSLVLIHLTPFAWRSGQTSSMVGGAQFKATLLTVKHLPAIYNAKWQVKILVNNARGWQAAFCSMKVNSSRGCPFLQVYVSKWAEGNTPTTLQEVTHRKLSSRTANTAKAGTG